MLRILLENRQLKRKFNYNLSSVYVADFSIVDCGLPIVTVILI